MVKTFTFQIGRYKTDSMGYAECLFVLKYLSFSQDEKIQDMNVEMLCHLFTSSPNLSYHFKRIEDEYHLISILDTYSMLKVIERIDVAQHLFHSLENVLLGLVKN